MNEIFSITFLYTHQPSYKNIAPRPFRTKAVRRWSCSVSCFAEDFYPASLGSPPSVIKMMLRLFCTLVTLSIGRSAASFITCIVGFIYCFFIMLLFFLVAFGEKSFKSFKSSKFLLFLLFDL